MWIWDFQLKELGFRKRSDLYWQCNRGFGLGEDEHLSLFLWTEQSATSGKIAYQLSEFHITFLLECNSLHFYYHEHGDNRWEPGGQTSSLQISALGFNPKELRSEADAIAECLIKDIHGIWQPREED